MGITVTRDEADGRKQEMHDRKRQALRAGDPDAALRFDTSALRHTDPEAAKAYRFRWINKNPKRVAEYEGHGYEIVKADDDTVGIAYKQSGNTSGGKEIGDLVLMRTPRANYERRRAAIRRRGELWENAGRDQAIDRLNKIARDGGLAKPHEDVVFDESGKR